MWIGRKEKNAETALNIRMSENSRCVIVMTNLAFAPEGRKRSTSWIGPSTYKFGKGIHQVHFKVYG